jgi:hypothetical protein
MESVVTFLKAAGIDSADFRAVIIYERGCEGHSLGARLRGKSHNPHLPLRATLDIAIKPSFGGNPLPGSPVGLGLSGGSRRRDSASGDIDARFIRTAARRTT